MLSDYFVSGRAGGKTAKLLEALAKSPGEFVTIKNDFKPIPVVESAKWYESPLRDDEYWRTLRDEQAENYFSQYYMQTPFPDLLSELHNEYEQSSKMVPGFNYELLLNDRTSRELKRLFKRDPGSLEVLAKLPHIIIPHMKDDDLMVVPIYQRPVKKYSTF